MENLDLAPVEDDLGGDAAIDMSHPLGLLVDDTQENNIAEAAEILHALDGPDIIPESHSKISPAPSHAASHGHTPLKLTTTS